MKRKITWWQALILIGVVVAAIYVLFSKMESAEFEGRERPPINPFSGTTVGRVGVSGAFYEKTKRVVGRAPAETQGLEKIVVDKLEQEKLLEKDLSPEAFKNIRRNDDVILEIECHAVDSDVLWKATLHVVRPLEIEAGLLTPAKRVMLSQEIRAEGTTPRTELRAVLEKTVQGFADELVKSLKSAPTDPKPAFQSYSGGGWVYQRSFVSEDAPRGAGQAGTQATAPR